MKNVQFGTVYKTQPYDGKTALHLVLMRCAQGYQSGMALRGEHYYVFTGKDAARLQKVLETRHEVENIDLGMRSVLTRAKRAKDITEAQLQWENSDTFKNIRQIEDEAENSIQRMIKRAKPVPALPEIEGDTEEAIANAVNDRFRNRALTVFKAPLKEGKAAISLTSSRLEQGRLSNYISHDNDTYVFVGSSARKLEDAQQKIDQAINLQTFLETHLEDKPELLKKAKAIEVFKSLEQMQQQAEAAIQAMMQLAKPLPRTVKVQ